ncbi:hypothetical protein [Colwellia sp. UCD-KL20]|uniref:hypothetical protein n=1 Tax=Colwellia sp. UCD-KL20 TaxID=1917165 RepID=UPI0009704778|nr:hypothetical protein [Colwellia sp. UCD-KL20]
MSNFRILAISGFLSFPALASRGGSCNGFFCDATSLIVVCFLLFAAIVSLYKDYKEKGFITAVKESFFVKVLIFICAIAIFAFTAATLAKEDSAYGYSFIGFCVFVGVVWFKIDEKRSKDKDSL